MIDLYTRRHSLTGLSWIPIIFPGLGSDLDFTELKHGISKFIVRNYQHHIDLYSWTPTTFSLLPSDFLGVGSGLDFTELNNMASQPQCTHVQLLNDYAELNSLVSEIKAVSCSGKSQFWLLTSSLIVTPKTDDFTSETISNSFFPWT